MSELRTELAQHLQAHYQSKTQAESCETVLFDGLQNIALELGQRVAIEGVQMIVAEVQKWVQCRLSGGSQPPQSRDVAIQSQLEAANLLNDVADLALSCAKDNFRVIFTGGIQAFLAAVARCVASKLLGGIGGGGGIFTEKPVGRCG